MKKILLMFIVSFFVVSNANAAITEADVHKLLKQTVDDIKNAADPKTVLEKINKGEHPYKDKVNPDLYAFVYDDKINMAAHPDKNLVEKNFKGKPDVCGCMFRDEIINKALGTTSETKCKKEEAKDVVHYVYKNPKNGSLEYKKSNFAAVTAKNGNKYVVVVGTYVKKMEGCENK